MCGSGVIQKVNVDQLMAETGPKHQSPSVMYGRVSGATGVLVKVKIPQAVHGVCMSHKKSSDALIMCLPPSEDDTVVTAPKYCCRLRHARAVNSLNNTKTPTYPAWPTAQDLAPQIHIWERDIRKKTLTKC
jgi:hypothetical protein